MTGMAAKYKVKYFQMGLLKIVIEFVNWYQICLKMWSLGPIEIYAIFDQVGEEHKSKVK